MEKEKRNRNAIRSRNLLINAFVELVQDSPIGKITVTQIVSKAGLNRSTFYAHFKSPEDIVKYIDQDIVNNLSKFIENVDAASIMNNPAPLMDRVADFVMEKEEFYKMFAKIETANTFLIQLEEMVIEKIMESEQSNSNTEHSAGFSIKLRFLVGGYVSLYRDWFRGKITMTPHEFSNILSKALTNDVESYL